MKIALFSREFWGIYFILAGSLVILRTHVWLNIPVFRMALALLLIWSGLVVLIGRGIDPGPEQNTVAFADRTVAATSGEYSALFGRGTFVVPEPGEGEGRILEVNAVFGGATVRVPRDVPVRVAVSSAFGAVRTPDGDSSFFGDRTYASPGYSEEAGFIRLKASAVFGILHIITD